MACSTQAEALRGAPTLAESRLDVGRRGSSGRRRIPEASSKLAESWSTLDEDAPRSLDVVVGPAAELARDEPRRSPEAGKRALRRMDRTPRCTNLLQRVCERARQAQQRRRTRSRRSPERRDRRRPTCQASGAARTSQGSKRCSSERRRDPTPGRTAPKPADVDHRSLTFRRGSDSEHEASMRLWTRTKGMRGSHAVSQRRGRSTTEHREGRPSPWRVCSTHTALGGRGRYTLKSRSTR